MFLEGNLDIETSCARDEALRHPDGSIDFGAYRERARVARRAAIKSAATAALSLLASAFAGRPAPAARHRAT
jgi:hypothetical protein